MTKNELFRYWIEWGETPTSLLEKLAARNAMPSSEVEELKRIVAFAEHLERAKQATAAPGKPRP